MRYTRLGLIDLLSVCILVCVAPGSNTVKAAAAVTPVQLLQSTRAEGQLFSRGPNSQWSFYNVQTGNAGSCGRHNLNSDFVVAMNIAQMTSSLCFKTITMTYGGETTTARITDTCPTCPSNGLDLSEGLFTFFAGSLNAGVITGDWELT